MRKLLSVVLAGFITFSQAGAEEPPILDGVKGTHGIAMHGDLKYGPDFTHFDYVNPDAPKGGSFHMATVGDGFDSFNTVIPKGTPAVGLGLIYDSLLHHSGDEAFSEYAGLAEYVFMPEDRSWVAFRINPKARWHDGTPITAEDVVWTFNTTMEIGSPRDKFYYKDVKEAVELDKLTVKFLFSSNTNRELPLILGQQIVLPKHYWESRPSDKGIDKTSLEPPLGSGPYKVKTVRGNRSISYERVHDYWGRDIPSNKGSYNFDEIRYDYYPENAIALEAFKAGDFDLRSENSAKNWALAYEIPAYEQGRIVKDKITNMTSQVMVGLIYNMRKDKFKDRRVRKALTNIFDFTWTNKNLFFGQYNRVRSFFGSGELAAKGLPKGRELEILLPYKDQLPPEVFTQEYNPPSTKKPGDLRQNLLKAAALLKEAGWIVDPDTLMLKNKETGQPFKFDIMMGSKTLESVLLPIVRNLRRLGVDAELKIVDSSQYVERRRKWDYDVIYHGWGQSLSPGNEQRFYWGSESADSPSSQNYSGVKNPILDDLIEKVINAPDRAELIAATRAMDRVLQWEYLLMPSYTANFSRLAYWNKFRQPEKRPLRGYDIMTWWFDPELARKNGLLGNENQKEGTNG